MSDRPFPFVEDVAVLRRETGRRLLAIETRLDAIEAILAQMIALLREHLPTKADAP